MRRQVQEQKAYLAKLHETAKGALASLSGRSVARTQLGQHGCPSQSVAGQRERMLQSTERMAKTGERITQGRQQLLETEVCTTTLGCCTATLSRQVAGQGADAWDNGVLPWIGSRSRHIAEPSQPARGN